MFFECFSYFGERSGIFSKTLFLVWWNGNILNVVVVVVVYMCVGNVGV